MKPSVCFLAGTLGRGGAERQMVYMLGALAKRDIPTRVISFGHGEAYEAEIAALGVRCTSVSSTSKVGRIAEVVRDLRREPASVIQSVQTYVNLYGVVGARACGGIELGAVRTDLSRDLEGSYWLVGRVSLWAPRFLLANSQAGVRAAKRYSSAPDNVLLLQNVIDTERFYPAPVPRSESPVRVLFLGRIHRQKRPDRFLRAAAALHRRLPGVAECWIAGKGPLREGMERYATSLGLHPPMVRFLGETSNPAELLRDVDLVALTSDWEGQPNTLIEAMGTGLPVLSTRQGAVDEVVPRDAGIVVELEDETALADGLCKLVSDRELRHRCGQRGLQHVRRELALEGLGARLMAVYERVLATS